METEEQAIAEFNELARPLIKWIAENKHPHTQIIIDATSAVLWEGIWSLSTEEFLID